MNVERNVIPTARVILKTSKIGNTVTLKRVTPAELMFLIADNHTEAGGDPLVKIEPEVKMTKGMVPARDTIGIELKDEEGNPLPEVEGWVKTDEQIVFKMTPKQELNRLAQKYGKRIKKFYPGQMPVLPQTFDEAKENGLGGTTSTERLLEVGGE